jgi:hypothetical protein
MAVKDDTSGVFEWSTGPFWRDERTALIACAQALEMAHVTQRMLLEFAQLYLRPYPQTQESDRREPRAREDEG